MRRAFVAASLAAAVAALVVARPKELNVTLKWNPNEKQAIPAINTTGGLYQLAVAPIADKRDKGTQIGENTEDKVPVPVHTSSDVHIFLGDHLVEQLKKIGLDTVAGDSGDRVLKADLVELWVAESNRYRGTVRLRAAIVGQDGKERWNATVAGTSENFGRSLKPDNYTEALSNSIQDLAAKLVSADGFRQAIAK